MTHVSCVACFLHGVEGDPSAIRRDRRKNSVGDLFLAGAVEIRDVNGVIAFESDALIGRKRSYAKTGYSESEENGVFDGNAIVTKKVTASANTRTIRYTNPPKRNLKMLMNHPWR